MTPLKQKTLLDVSLNDSDDSVFQTETQKRKLKPASPKPKRRKKTFEHHDTNSTSVTLLTKSKRGDKEEKKLCENSKTTEEDKTTTVQPAVLGKRIEKAPNFLQCPLCNKQFENHFTHLSHMKQCAKKRKISTAELLRTLELKAMVEKKGTEAFLGCSAPSMDLLPNNQENSANCGEAGSDSVSSVKLSKPSSEGQKTTLDKFGFTTSTPSMAAVPTGRRGKNSKLKSYVLKNRTAQERLRILTEKASVILLSSEDNIHIDSEASSICLPDDIPKLWNKAESDLNGSWYLENLKHHFNPLPPPSDNNCDEDVGFETSSVDSSDGSRKLRQGFPERDKEENMESLHDDSDSQPKILPSSPPILDEPLSLVGFQALSPEENLVCTPVREYHTLHLKTNTLHADWKALVGSSKWSDDCLESKDSTVPIHKLVFSVRCPNFDLEELKIISKQVSSSSLLSILDYVYCNQLTKVAVTDLTDCILLARTLGLDELHRCLQESENLPSPNSRSIFENTTIIKDPDILADDVADTVPVQNHDDDIVDLTQSLSPSPKPENNTDDEEERWNIFEKAEELAKIDSFIEQSSSYAYKELAEECEEDNREREKIFNMSIESVNEDSETDIFTSCSQSKEPNKSTNPSEVVVLSSDSEHSKDINIASDDEIIDSSIVKEKGRHEEYNVPFFDSPGSDVFIDYELSSEKAQGPTTSQSLLDASLKTTNKDMLPKNISDELEKTLSPPAYSIGISDSQVIEDRNDSSHVSPAELVSEEILSTPKKRRHGTKRRSLAMRLSSKIVHRSVRALAQRRRSRSRISRATPITSTDIALSNSMFVGMDESWNSNTAHPTTPRLTSVANDCGASTPTSSQRPFVEITPCATPSMKLSDKVTPRPDYSGMKTDSLKKNLQKYGLKRSLGKVKARKILRHIYEEYHPVVNTATGKFVKFIADDTGKGRQKKKPKKISSENKNMKTNSKDNGKEKTLCANKVAKNQEPSSVVPDFDLEHSSESDENGDEFSGVEDDILTQATKTSIPLEEAFCLYLREHPDFHLKVLCYEPVWVETFRKDLQIYSQSKYKITDVMEFLDQKCISFRSEQQSINNQRRNEKKKARLIRSRKAK